MLTKRQNFLETIRGGNPDRFVNQYEFLEMMRGDPISGQVPALKIGETAETAQAVLILESVSPLLTV